MEKARYEVRTSSTNPPYPWVVIDHQKDGQPVAFCYERAVADKYCRQLNEKGYITVEA